MATHVEDVPTVTGRLQKLSDEDPDKAAFVFWNKDHERTVFTRREVFNKSKKCAAMLRKLGVTKGDIVCNSLPNSRERVITTFGTILAGAASMHGQKFLADGEDIIMNLRDSQCKFIIVDPNDANGVSCVLGRILSVDKDTGEIAFEGLPFLKSVIPVVLGDGHESWLKKLDHETDTYIDESPSPDDIALIFVTSGSTGFAKLVPHSSHSLYELGIRWEHCFYLSRPDGVLFTTCSLGWIGGCPVDYIFPGTTRVVLDYGNGVPKDLPTAILRVLEDEICTCAMFLPSVVQSLLDALDRKRQYALQPLIKTFITGGSSITKASMAAIGRVSESVINVYGSTEADMLFTLLVKDPESFERGCVGYPSNGVNVKILDEDMKEVATGTSGEIFIQSPTCTKHYVNNPHMSSKSFLEGGWYRTSDIGYHNDKGQLFVSCRKSNNINHKGFIHYPDWMEARLDRHPNIQSSVVVGVPDPVNNENICVCVIQTANADLDSDEILRICKGMFLTGEDDPITPVPTYCFLFDVFPVNVNGKLDRRRLKDIVVKRIMDMK